MKKIVKSFIALFTIAAMLFMFGCTSEDSGQDAVIKLAVSSKSITNDLSKDVLQIKANPIDSGECKVAIVGASFEKSTGDLLQDSMNIGMGLDSDFIDGVSKGFDMGFANSANNEVSNMDAYLCIYLKFSIEGDEVSQRNSVIPDLEISATDNQGSDFYLVHNSMDDQYINVEYPYGMIILKGYYDSNAAFITLNDTNYQLDLEQLK